MSKIVLLPAQVANHSTGFGSPCPLMELSAVVVKCVLLLSVGVKHFNVKYCCMLYSQETIF